MTQVTELINLTGHTVSIIIDEHNRMATITATLPPLRIKWTIEDYATFGMIPILSKTVGFNRELPEEVPGRMYVVSSVVFHACPDRMDFCYPSSLVQDKSGRVFAARHLITRNPSSEHPHHAVGCSNINHAIVDAQ